MFVQGELSRMPITSCKQRICGRSTRSMTGTTSSWKPLNDKRPYLGTFEVIISFLGFDNSSFPHQVVSWEIRRAPLLPQLERVLDQVWGLGLVQCQELLQVTIFYTRHGSIWTESHKINMSVQSNNPIFENCMLLSATSYKIDSDTLDYYVRLSGGLWEIL